MLQTPEEYSDYLFKGIQKAKNKALIKFTEHKPKLEIQFQSASDTKRTRMIDANAIGYFVTNLRRELTEICPAKDRNNTEQERYNLIRRLNNTLYNPDFWDGIAYKKYTLESAANVVLQHKNWILTVRDLDAMCCGIYRPGASMTDQERANKKLEKDIVHCQDDIKTINYETINLEKKVDTIQLLNKEAEKKLKELEYV